MPALLTNQELGLPENATKTERDAALEKACREHLALMAKKPSYQEKENGTTH